jgi:hypothetical protein
MRKDFQKLIDTTISSLDWDSIYQVHKVFKFGVGEGSEVIPGIKRKIYSESLTKNDIKNELKSLIKFAIENDVSKLAYGQWMIFWFNQEWGNIEIDQDQELDESDSPEEEIANFDSRLEVIYSPQRICLTVNAAPSQISENPGYKILSDMMESALKKENYELAKKIKDILDLADAGSESDK